MNIRQVLESTVLACYALFKPKENEFIYTNSDGLLCEKKIVKGKSYTWLEEKYPYHNGRIKYLKDRINETFAHSNLITAFSNVDHDLDSFKMDSHFFGQNDDFLVKLQLWMIANVSLGQIELINLVLKHYPLAKVKYGYKEKLERLWNNNNRLRGILKNDPRFPESKKRFY